MNRYSKSKVGHSRNTDIVNKEENYKINVNRVRSYFMTPTQGPLKLAYENPKGYSYQHGGSADGFIVASPVGQKVYCWIHNDMLTNTICVDYIVPGNGETVSGMSPQNIPIEIVYGGIEGTILYGTRVFNKFIIDDIFYFQGKYVSYATWFEKMVLYKHIFTTYPSIVTGSNAFVLPYICHTIDDLYRMASQIGYKIGTIQYKRWNSKKSYVYSTMPAIIPASYSCPTPQPRQQQQQQQQQQQWLWTKADIKADIYYLYETADADATKTIGAALIPNYKTSVKMNQLFRNIKENARLDALEESDDEEEFENTADDKFITEKEPIKLQYSWHPKFRKYFPVF